MTVRRRHPRSAMAPDRLPNPDVWPSRHVPSNDRCPGAPSCHPFSRSGAERQVFEHETYGTLPDFSGIPRLSFHGSILSRAGASRKAGAVQLSFHATMGAYDYVMVAEGPSDELAALMSMSIAAQGYVTTQTLRAFTPEAFAGLVSQLP